MRDDEIAVWEYEGGRGQAAPVFHIGWVNVYRSGFFHTAGKPGAYDRHPGDIYETEAAAIADIHPRSHYIATVPIAWAEPTRAHVNPCMTVCDSLTCYSEDDKRGHYVGLDRE